ncbi:MAG TPA: SagB/ThcOx family dehydrogenase [Desulfobaccales bacterium]|nr:SagB/ThcOx family dehydrogenase [Desulfobaccales bacterium]
MMNLWWSLIMALGIMLFTQSGAQAAGVLKLPPPEKKGGMPLTAALEIRRTVRRFAARPLDLAQVSQILWSADGLNDPRGLRTSPSAGATYPLDLYLVVGERGVLDLAEGIYHYRVAEHALAPVAAGDLRAPVVRACLHQTWMAQAPVMVVITGEYRRCTARYGQRGIRYTHMESGNVSQNVFLASEALGLGPGSSGPLMIRPWLRP